MQISGNYFYVDVLQNLTVSGELQIRIKIHYEVIMKIHYLPWLGLQKKLDKCWPQ